VTGSSGDERLAPDFQSFRDLFHMLEAYQT
jgi:hypothetical protein